MKKAHLLTTTITKQVNIKMAVVRELNNSDLSTYLSTVALFCGISCTIVMIRFKGFKATLNLSSGKLSEKHYEVAPQTSVAGAYRTSKEEYFGNVNYLEARKIISPSMVKLPPTNTQTHGVENIKPSKSTGDLTNTLKAPVNIAKSTPDVRVQNESPTTTGAKNQLKIQKKLEKERLIEQKKKDKLAAQEREKEEKLKKEREKQAARQAKEAKEREKQRKNKGLAPQPQKNSVQQTDDSQKPTNNLQREQHAPLKREAPPPPPQYIKVAQRVQPNTNPLVVSQNCTENYRNSLESSISRSSGPPPYSDSSEIVPNDRDNTGNTSFVKPAEVSSSWDLISQHRQQMSRTGANIHNSKQKNMDLKYNVGNLMHDKDNSEA